ncbi:hypothetical protein [Pedobacter agri]|uniref:hypothetical protein n=1 Tax=Pedobacter agri TaxID=454586 RepID=UPI00278B7201|nr:hypothetical protein [Pedobacter agri]MDQ1139422.1 hypothetical protein [Pedobacter agri]
MIKITADFSMAELEAIINDETEAWFDELVDEYRSAGKAFVERAVQKAQFNNITWNLRSSIGYVIMYNGQVIESFFKDLIAGTEGQEVGKDYAKFVLSLIDEGDGLSMALVAGEEYAYYVEAKGKDVISGSWAFFTTELRGALK